MVRLSGFPTFLRANGYAVGGGDAVQVLHTARVVGVLDAPALRYSLQALLCGRADEWRRYDELLDAWFLPANCWQQLRRRGSDEQALSGQWPQGPASDEDAAGDDDVVHPRQADSRQELLTSADFNTLIQREHLLDIEALMRRFARQIKHLRLRREVTAVTTALHDSDPWRAQEKLHLMAAGWAGGTRIGESIAQFNREHAPRAVHGRTAVIIMSDGYDTGEPAVLSNALTQLRRRARRIVWLNPLCKRPGYAPISAGMQAALPHLDLLAPGVSLDDIAAVLPQLLQALRQYQKDPDMGCILKANSGLFARMTVGAVLLAAGAGERLGGRPKALLELGGVLLILRQLIALSDAGVDEVVVVLGHHAAAVEAAIGPFPITLVHNPAPDDGQASSVRVGLHALSPKIDAVIVALADQPLIAADDIVALIGAYKKRGDAAMVVRRVGTAGAAASAGLPGNPVMFDAALCEAWLDGSVNGACRQWRDTSPERVRWFDTDNRRYRIDIDTPEDLLRLTADTGHELRWPAALQREPA